MGHDSSVAKATHKGLDGLVIVRGAGQIFRTRPETPWDSPCTMVSFSFPEVNWPGHGLSHLTLSSAEITIPSGL